jgi:glycosyltransferase involved in cell wall biosynthesis
VTDAASQWRLGAHNQGIVGTVGEFRRVKDIPLLIRGYAGMAPGQRRRLLLAGHFTDAHEQAWSRQLIEELGIAGETWQSGHCAPARVRRLLRCMRVYCQSSADEGLPNALLEAAALGVPLVATAVGGMAEVIADGETGLLVPHGDACALTGALGAVLSDEALARRLCAGARRLATQLSSARECAAWLALYQRLLAGSPA